MLSCCHSNGSLQTPRGLHPPDDADRESSGQAGDTQTFGSGWRDRVFLEPGLVPEEDNA